MGIELARAYVKVRGDASELANDLSGVAGMVQDALSDARTYAAGFLAKIAQMGEGFLAVGRQMRDSNEETKINFETLIGSVEETDELLRKLTAFAVKTPFEMPQLLSVTQELLTFGERGDELMGTIKMLGDASQGNAGKFSILGVVFNQIRGVSKLLTQDFRQLSTRGILFLTDIAKYYKITEAEAQKKLSSGAIKFEDVRGIFKMLTSEGGRFFNAMEKQANSMSGLKSTLNDAWNIMARGVAEVLEPVEKLTLKIKIGLVEALQSAVQATDGLVAGATVGAIKMAKLSSVILAGSVAMRIFGVSAKTALMGTGIGAVILVIGAAIGTLTTYFFKSASGIYAVSQVSEDLAIVWANLKTAAMTLVEALGEVFQNITGETFSDYMKIWSSGIASVATTFTGWLVKMSEALLPFINTVASVVRNIKELFIINGIDIAISFINAFQSIEEANSNMWNGIMRAMTGVVAFVKTIVNNIIQPFKSIGIIIAAEGAAAFAGFKAAINGGNMGEIQQAMNDSVEKSMAGTKLDPKLDQKIADLKEYIEFEKRQAAANPNNSGQRQIDIAQAEKDLAALEAAKAEQASQDPFKAFEDAYNNYVDQVADQPIGEDMKKELEDMKKAYLDIIAEREALRKKAAGQDPNAPNGQDPNAPKPTPDTPIIEAGRYGFAQFGTKLQDAILKGKGGDQQQKMVDLLGQGNNIQQQMLDQQKKNKAGLGP